MLFDQRMGSYAVLSDRVENFQNSQKLGGIFLNVSLEMLRKFKKNLSKNLKKNPFQLEGCHHFQLGFFENKLFKRWRKICNEKSLESMEKPWWLRDM